MKNKIEFSKIKILVCCHKKCELPLNKTGIYLPIQVGAAISDINLGILCDNLVNGVDCDNISAKNKSYCELTAVYWAWKNIKKMYPNIEYIGLCHYRRFFTSDGLSFFEKGRIVAKHLYKSFRFLFQIPSSEVVLHQKNSTMNDFNRAEKRIAKKISNVFARNKETIITVRKVTFNGKDVNEYFSAQGKFSVKYLRRSIENCFPNYVGLFDKSLMQNKMYFANMFIMPFSIFDEYCEFLFSILDEFIQITKKENVFCEIFSEKSAERLLGYQGELLTNVFLQTKKRIYEMNYTFIGE